MVIPQVDKVVFRDSVIFRIYCFIFNFNKNIDPFGLHLFIKLKTIAIFVLSEESLRCHFRPITFRRKAIARLNNAILRHTLNYKYNIINILHVQVPLNRLSTAFM